MRIDITGSSKKYSYIAHLKRRRKVQNQNLSSGKMKKENINQIIQNMTSGKIKNVNIGQIMNNQQDKELYELYCEPCKGVMHEIKLSDGKILHYPLSYTGMTPDQDKWCKDHKFLVGQYCNCDDKNCSLVTKRTFSYS
tara:strand:- start:1115 stop:1528 length:414 start_codon:yes stop_codon:yes gene_type:complete